MILDNLRFKVDINVKPGAYTLGTESATGKSFLCKLLKDYKLLGLPVSSYSFSDRAINPNPLSVFDNNPQLILLDRYDMFRAPAIDFIIKKRSASAIILIDYKGDDFEDVSTDWVFLTLLEGKIIVTSEV